MSHIPKLLNAFSRLLSYPGEYTPQTAELLYVVLQGELPEAASEAAAFGAFVEQHELWEVEEAFTRVFDVNPACALEVGWHLFGEEYARGMFLVRMREEMRKYNLPESVELPDHISHVLAVVSAMSPEEATRFVKACVQPAIEKMKQAFAGKDSPYSHVVTCLSLVLTDIWGEFTPADEPAVRGRSQAFESDPLRAFPVADVDCGSGCDSGCGESEQFVPLTVSRPTVAGQLNTETSIEKRTP